jgi:hypothetical protein
MVGPSNDTTNRELIYIARRRSEARRSNSMAKIDELTYGSIAVEGKRYSKGVLVSADAAILRHNSRLNGLVDQSEKVATLIH